MKTHHRKEPLHELNLRLEVLCSCNDRVSTVEETPTSVSNQPRGSELDEYISTHLNRDQSIFRILFPTLHQRLLAHELQRIRELFPEQFDDRVVVPIGSFEIVLRIERFEGCFVSE